MKEGHYAIDSIDMRQDNWEYLVEGGVEDTRLIKRYVEDGRYYVLRPYSLEQNKRLDNCGKNCIDIINNFKGLTNEIQDFGFKIPPYDTFISEIHTIEGSKGSGICIASEYIHGKCLPLEFNGHWQDKRYVFYERMDEWLTKITNYTVAKYLSADEETLYLTDVFRPIQFAYSFEDKMIYLVDLDPLFENVFNNKGEINLRFLVGLNTINAYRNKYLNKISKENIDYSKFGIESRNIMLDLVKMNCFKHRSVYNKEAYSIVKNLQQGLTYKKVNNPLEFT